jgi:hypothetical protein
MPKPERDVDLNPSRPTDSSRPDSSQSRESAAEENLRISWLTARRESWLSEVKVTFTNFHYAQANQLVNGSRPIMICR